MLALYSGKTEYMLLLLLQCDHTSSPKKEISTGEIRHYIKSMHPNLADEAASQTQGENNNFGILYCDPRMTFKMLRTIISTTTSSTSITEQHGKCCH